MNFLYVNNTGCDLSPFGAEIRASLLKDGTLPSELSDLFVVHVACENPDGTPRYRIDAA